MLDVSGSAGSAQVAPVISVAGLVNMAGLAGLVAPLGAQTGASVVVADARWYLDGRDGRAAYLAGHVPGAVWVDLEAQLAAHDRPATEGRHPFPTPEGFATAMSSLGIGDDTLVVAYDDSGGVTAGRLVVMLRMLGRNAALLDGGLVAWQQGGNEVATGPEPAGQRPPAVFTPRPWPADRLAGPDETLEHAARGGAVLDARAHERFTGDVAMIDPRPGHIPGARNAPWASVLGPDGRMRPPAELRAHFAELGVGAGDRPGQGAITAITYCGSGVSACMNVLAMEVAGLEPPRLYVASWSGWSADPERPAELGG
jgi:thiosulfate/3-mercaptopyruvate sulfurtransferase